MKKSRERSGSAVLEKFRKLKPVSLLDAKSDDGLRTGDGVKDSQFISSTLENIEIDRSVAMRRINKEPVTIVMSANERVGKVVSLFASPFSWNVKFA